MKLKPALRYSLLLLVAALVLMPNRTRAQYAILGQTKEELKLKYDVSVGDLGNGRVSVIFTIADEGMLKPLTSVDLQIAGRDKDKNGAVAPELCLSLAMQDAHETAGIIGKRTRFELTRELAERAEIWLMAAHLDGKQMPLTGYVHRIPIEQYMKNATTAPATAAPGPEPAAAPRAAPAPPASERKN